MKIKHYTAPDMRQALRQVREAQGPDAVILSTRRVAAGVEVVAAIDYDEAAPSYEWPTADRASAGRATPTGSRSHEAPAAEHGPAGSASDYALLARRMQHPDDFSLDASSRDERTDVNEELRMLRRMLETQLATLAWNDLARRAPLQTELLRRLTVLGVAHDLAGELVAQLPARLELSEAHRLALALLARRITIMEERWMDVGGVVA